MNELTKTMKTFVLGFSLMLVTCVVHSTNNEQIKQKDPISLKTENLVDPIGIGDANPRFSWVDTSSVRGWKQSAYQLIVASSEACIKRNTGDMWNTGKVASSAQWGIKYAGSTLQPGKKYWWKVRVYDQKGNVSSYSAAATFETGLFSWEHSSWIGGDYYLLRDDFVLDSTKTIASAMRLAGVSKSDVVDTVAIINKSWDFFKYAVDYLEDPRGKVKTAMNGDAVIYLFNDAHYALNGGRLDETGTMVPHYTINTMAEKLMPDWESATPVSTTYRVSFKDEFVFNNFTFKDIDLFIITGYNMSYYETHIHSYVGVNVLNNYPCNIDYLPWALLVPDKFVYPNEGVCICKYTKDLNYFEGAYQMGSYSFGAWAKDHNNSKACAWYHYPIESEVYPAN